MGCTDHTPGRLRFWSRAVPDASGVVIQKYPVHGGQSGGMRRWLTTELGLRSADVATVEALAFEVQPLAGNPEGSGCGRRVPTCGGEGPIDHGPLKLGDGLS